jgi:hypothetical protein
MFPEESFGEIDWGRIEERWRNGQGYKEGKDVERGSWISGRITEWVNRDDIGERGRHRVGWRCVVHGWGYWVRLISWEDDDFGDEDDDDEQDVTEDKDRREDSHIIE